MYHFTIPFARVAKCALIVVMMAALQSDSVANADDLRRLREDVRTPREKPSQSNVSDEEQRKKNDPLRDDDDADLPILGELFGGAMLFTASAPFWYPHYVLNDDYEYQTHFPEFPYVDDWDGHLVIHFPSVEPLRSWSGRWRSEYGDGFDGMSRIGGHLLVDTASRFGFDSEWNHRRQKLSNGGHDSLSTGDFNVFLRFAQSEKIEFRTGIGLNWLDDSIDTNYGFNFTYGVDVFPAKPWVLSTTIDWGTLGRASLFHSRTTVGLLLDRYEFFTGYDYFRVGSVDIDGIVGGIRIWF